MTIHLDAGQDSKGDFATFQYRPALRRYMPVSDYDLTAPARQRAHHRRAGAGRRLTACDTRRKVAEQRAILTHSELHASQAGGFDGTTLAKAAQRAGRHPGPRQDRPQRNSEPRS